MKSDDFPVLVPALSFLKKYGNLKMKFINKRHGKIDDFNFDVCRATEIIVVERSEEYLLRIGCKHLCLIGTAHREHIILMIDENGKVYGCYESELMKIGDSGTAAIEGIIMGHDFQEIK